MRTLLLLLISMNFLSAKAQKGEVEPTEIHINIGDNGIKEQSLNQGDYKIIFDHNYDTSVVSHYEARITITTEPIEPLNYVEPLSAVRNMENFKVDFKVTIKPRTKVVIEVLEFLVKDNEIKTYTYTLKGIKEKKWVTSFGLAGAYLLQSQTYKTIADGDAFRVVPDSNQNIIDAIPVVQFSYINIKNDNGFAWTGGLGFDTENLSAFAGGSFYVGHNLLLTAGAAMHRQSRRSNQFSNDQIVPEALDSSVVNQEFYRVNPFISLTFVMNKNFLKD